MNPKKVGIAAGAGLVLVLGGAFGWKALHRPHRGAPPADEEGSFFLVEGTEEAPCAKLRPQATPLRSVRWLPPLPGGYGVVQVLTQTGRQSVGLFQEGRLLDTFAVPRPGFLGEGPFGVAELRDAVVAPGEALVLLYGRGESGEDAFVLALDLKERRLRWAHKAPGERLRLLHHGGTVVLFGRATAPVRLPLAAQPSDKDLKAQRASAKALDLPPEVKEISDALPLPGEGLALAHAGGLSLWQKEAWTHHPAPASGLHFHEPGRLVKTEHSLWWQPAPGSLYRVEGDGTLKAEDLGKRLPKEAPALDAPLLALLGADSQGRLWLAPAAPDLPAGTEGSVPAPAAAPEAEAPVAEGEEKDEAEAEPEKAPSAPALDVQALRDHVQKGLERAYVWRPGGSAKAAAHPPQPVLALRPEARGTWAEQGDRHCWTSLPKD